jgi:hypothetical protein
MHRLLMLATVVVAVMACKKEEQLTRTGGGSGSAPATQAPPATVTPPPTTPPPATGTATSSVAVDPAPGPGSSMLPMPPAPGGPRPATITDAHVATADKLVTSLTELGAKLAAAGSDCKAATKVITAGTAAMTPIADDAEKIKTETAADPAAKAWFQANYVPKMMTAYGPFVAIAKQCNDDTELMAALAAMPIGNRKKRGP